ncbi:hypothetical protein A5782_09015 [Mycobacterium sp. 852002-40037_SCH5390672]|nr:hypothetical protein A5782_09015 [Mycobacterium sp. 852002-40037_SCH5390672]
MTATGSFLPGEPVPNEEIDEYIGAGTWTTAEVKERILANCGIKTRHYALNKSQETLYSNRAMAAAAVRDTVANAAIEPAHIDLLACATTLPDLLGPGHASMVHGELNYPPCEIVTTHGICSSGMMALKNAYLQVEIGEKSNAIAVASEFSSRGFKHTRYAEMRSTDEHGSLPVETVFLRYMLSDGAGAVLVQNRAKTSGVSLRIDWVSLTSFANTGDACMYFGSNTNSCEKTWMDYPTAGAAAADGALFARQRLALLPQVISIVIDEYQRLVTAGKFDPHTLTWMPAHYSSERMKSFALGEFSRRKIPSPKPEAWYSNLTRVGNVGSASIFIILDEMMTQELIHPGDTLLCMVPESGRFAVSYMHLTAVGPAISHD